MAKAYVSERGDIVWLQFDPQASHEQAGHRPAFVVSPRAYNRKVGLALFCPITSRVKGYPFEVPLAEGSKVRGAIFSDQLKSLDWKARKATRFDCATDAVIEEVTARILALVHSNRLAGSPASALSRRSNLSRPVLPHGPRQVGSQVMRSVGEASAAL